MTDSPTFPGQLFPLGEVAATPGALGVDGFDTAEVLRLLCRHCTGDWGELDVDDRERNDLALLDGKRILSSFDVRGHTVWCVTEADRSATTFLLPSEY